MQEDTFEKEEIKDHKVVRCNPWTETCFGCNGGPNQGVGMRTYNTEDGYVVGLVRTKDTHQGFPGLVHGGIIATYFDEVLWYNTQVLKDVWSMTVEMDVKYRKPIPVNTDIRIVGKPARVEGRHVYIEGFIMLPDDTVAATASVHYITLKSDASRNDEENTRIKHINPYKPDTIRF